MPDRSAKGDAGQHRAHGGSRSHNRKEAEAAVGGSQELPPVRPACRMWLERGGQHVFGPGAFALLARIGQTGSLNQAAKDLSMSYSKAWRIVREGEKRLGVQLLERSSGGREGGGSRLTEDGRLLLARYEAFGREADEAVKLIFARHLGDLPYADNGTAG